jgi:hypothetical protein
MIETWDVYVAFRKAQANYHNRPYRLPKDWAKHFVSMSQANQEAMFLAAERFNTRWSNIDMDKYLTVGFDLIGKGFTYTRFFDRRVMSLYMERDKIEKRNLVLRKADIVKSGSFVVKYMGGHGFLKEYSRKRDNFQSVPVRHYIQGKIDQYFLTWLIKEKHLILEDSDRAQIPYIIEKYRDYVAVLDELKGFMEKVKEKI